MYLKGMLCSPRSSLPQYVACPPQGLAVSWLLADIASRVLGSPIVLPLQVTHLCVHGRGVRCLRASPPMLPCCSLTVCYIAQGLAHTGALGAANMHTIHAANCLVRTVCQSCSRCECKFYVGPEGHSLLSTTTEAQHLRTGTVNLAINHHQHQFVDKSQIPLQNSGRHVQSYAGMRLFIPSL